MKSKCDKCGVTKVDNEKGWGKCTKGCDARVWCTTYVKTARKMHDDNYNHGA